MKRTQGGGGGGGCQDSRYEETNHVMQIVDEGEAAQRYSDVSLGGKKKTAHHETREPRNLRDTAVAERACADTRQARCSL